VWRVRNCDNLVFEHVETEKRVAISGCLIMANSPHASVQNEITRAAHRLLIENAKDRLFMACGRDADEFRRRVREGALAQA
jgi:hypothetical protein